jgi:hypothetical protein|tara:strand:- start:8256 stop:8597 length:342 start_codon:yes stop_codon:yes gene_type:complete
MRKTDKKIDNQLRLVLTQVCEVALKDIDGFQWLTHLVNYAKFPNSLKVICIFDTNANLANFLSSSGPTALSALIHTHLHSVNISVKDVKDHIVYDTEQDCWSQHEGHWGLRLG